MELQRAIIYRVWHLYGKKNFKTIGAFCIWAGISDSIFRYMTTVEGALPRLITIKKICDGFGITLGEFFSTPEFDALEQEI